MIDGALHGLKVIDLGRVLGGPYYTQALADHGARVIKFRPPVSDEIHTWDPPFDTSDTAWYFNGVNHNKPGISVDLACEEGCAMPWQLLEDADVLAENFKPGTLARWGMDFERDLQPRFPCLTHCAVSGFGPDGPLGGLPGYDVAIQMMASLMSVNGERDGDLMRVGLSTVDMVTGPSALVGVSLVLTEWGKSGRGQSIDIALCDCGVPLLHPHLPNYFGPGKVSQRSDNAHSNIAPHDSYQAGIAPIFLVVGNDRQFTRLCVHVGVAGLAQDARFADNRSRCAHYAELKVALEAQLTRFDCEMLTQDLVHSGVPRGSVLNVDVVACYPHTLYRQMVVELGEYRGTGSPIRLSRTPATYRNVPPVLDTDTDTVLASLGIDADTWWRLLQAGILKRSSPGSL